MEPRPAGSRVWADHLCRGVGFEPDVRFETDDLEGHLALVEAGTAVAIVPELMIVRRQPNVRWIDLPGDPRREVFTSTRTVIAAAPQIRVCRETLSEIVPPRLDLGSAGSRQL
ncbi:MAG: LysR substrate-binding domain-containing protein [Nocardioides sp.]|uniref:LysR substrate-binding domain-containing protein n=1 Tax=Nocardioides sp. TaxID=35761 RepID=UPI0039E4E91B